LEGSLVLRTDVLHEFEEVGSEGETQFEEFVGVDLGAELSEVAGLQQTGRGQQDALGSAGLCAFGGLGEEGGRRGERSGIGHPVYYRFQYGGLRAAPASTCK